MPRHLLHHLATAGLPLPDADTARAWLHDTGPDLLATVLQVLRLDVPGTLAPAVDLLTVWGELTQGTASHQDVTGPARLALDKARRTEDESAGASAARALRLLAVPRPGPDTLERAERELRASLRLGEAAGDALLPVLAGHELGLVLLDLGRPEEALPLLVRAEERLREEGAASGAAEALAHTARALVALGRTEEALAAVAEACDRARGPAGRTLARVLHEAGRVHLLADRSASASDRLREALAVEPEGTDPRWEALVWARLALCRLARLRNREAITAADRALAMEAGLGDPYCRGLALAARGRAQLALGEPRIALGCLREAYDVLRRRGAAEAAEVGAVLAEEFPGHESAP